MFEKKSKNVAEKMAAVDGRILELKKKKDSKAADIAEKQKDISSLLAILAMGENSKAQESLKLAKKSLERLTETFNDLNQQLTLLQDNRKLLEKEFLEATVRDLPARIELSLEEFNRVLDDSLIVLETLRSMHTKLRAAEKVFTDLSKEYQDSCVKLGIFKPLDLKTGLGALARVPSPHSMTFQVPEFLFFIQSLEGYRLKIASYEGFIKTNPDFHKNMAADAKGGEPLGFQNWLHRPWDHTSERD